ncbi:c-type cytochrome [Rubripirellula sp.]|jgi:putative heme-binding domain-containing protein|nr:c-type cytochrome [Rubripirellula sp.]MDB4749847.1 c-type cytochrome [Rubripirellula sp.]
MKYVLLIFLLAFSVCDLQSAKAVSDAESLALLVKTLNSNDNPAVRTILMRGMLSGLAGRRNVEPPEGWKELSKKLALSQNAEEQAMLQQLSQIFGDAEATERALATVSDTNADIETRRVSLRSLLAQQNSQVSMKLESLLADPALRLDAIRGYASIENASAPKILLSHYGKLDEPMRRAVIETLATRKGYATELLNAIESGRIARKNIPAHVARSLDVLLGEQFVKVFGEVEDLSADRAQLLAKYKAMCSPDAMEKADAMRGRAVFAKTCASCHLMYGAGGKIGPDLTGSNRANLDYILLNSVDPSYDVPEGYKMVLIQTIDGRLLNGVIAEEDARRVVLKTVEQPQVVIAKEDIEARKTSSKSMMPDGQLEQMKTQELLDLIKYLRTTAQVEKAK